MVCYGLSEYHRAWGLELVNTRCLGKHATHCTARRLCAGHGLVTVSQAAYDRVALFFAPCPFASCYILLKGKDKGSFLKMLIMDGAGNMAR